MEEAEKKVREEQERIAKQLAEGKAATQTTFSLSHKDNFHFVVIMTKMLLFCFVLFLNLCF